MFEWCIKTHGWSNDFAVCRYIEISYAYDNIHSYTTIIFSDRIYTTKVLVRDRQIDIIIHRSLNEKDRQVLYCMVGSIFAVCNLQLHFHEEKERRCLFISLNFYRGQMLQSVFALILRIYYIYMYIWAKCSTVKLRLPNYLRFYSILYLNIYAHHALDITFRFQKGV